MMQLHPEVAVTRVKETNFFYDDVQYRRGYRWFLNEYFRDTGPARVLFDADPAYMTQPHCIERIRECAPNAAIVATLRNPVDRAFSQYLYRQLSGRESLSFEEVCRYEPERIEGGGWRTNMYGYLERSRYGKHIEQILSVFPRRQVYFIVFERFVQNQAEEFAALQRWLGLSVVDPGAVRENPTGRPRSVWISRLLYDSRLRPIRRLFGRAIAHRGLKQALVRGINAINIAPFEEGEGPALDPETRVRLDELFAPDIRRIEELSGLDLSIWKPGAHKQSPGALDGPGRAIT